jgi:hypothetical protein
LNVVEGLLSSTVVDSTVVDSTVLPQLNLLCRQQAAPASLVLVPVGLLGRHHLLWLRRVARDDARALLWAAA